MKLDLRIEIGSEGIQQCSPNLRPKTREHTYLHCIQIHARKYLNLVSRELTIHFFLQSPVLFVEFQLGMSMRVRENAQKANICAYMREYRIHAHQKKVAPGHPYFQLLQLRPTFGRSTFDTIKI